MVGTRLAESTGGLTLRDRLSSAFCVGVLSLLHDKQGTELFVGADASQIHLSGRIVVQCVLPDWRSVPGMWRIIQEPTS